MSATLELEDIESGSAEYLEVAWQLKEEIRRRDGVLKQRRGFFTRAYRRARIKVLTTGEDLVGFAATRSDGYLLFLAVHPDYRDHGFGRELVAAVAQDHDVISCHARTSNVDAIGFYRHLGFEVDRRIKNYYEDGGDAFLLRLGDPQPLSERLKEYLTNS